ncbi:MAG: hypothetical protein ACK5PI_03450, partial [Acetobacteraceae bacterium]
MTREDLRKTHRTRNQQRSLSHFLASGRHVDHACQPKRGKQRERGDGQRLPKGVARPAVTRNKHDG